MRKHILIILIVLFVLFLFTFDTHATRVEKVIENHFLLVSKGLVSLKNVNGYINIFSWDKEEVKMVAVKSISKWGISYPEKYLDKIKIEIIEKPKSIRVNTRHPLFSWHINARVDYQLWVPDTINIRLESLRGNIQVKTQLNNISLKTDSGNIFLYYCENASSNLDVNTIAGKISNEFKSDAESTGNKKIQEKIGLGETDIKAKTVSGNIFLLKLNE